MGLFLSLMGLSLVGGVLYVLPSNHSLVPADRLRRPLTAMVWGLAGYILFGAGLMPLERISFIAAAVHNWLPYEILPAAVSLIFAGAGLLWMRMRGG